MSPRIVNQNKRITMRRISLASRKKSRKKSSLSRYLKREERAFTSKVDTRDPS